MSICIKIKYQFSTFPAILTLHSSKMNEKSIKYRHKKSINYTMLFNQFQCII